MKNCKTCNECKRVYTKTGLRFWKGKEYYCTANKRLVQTTDVCQMWQTKKAEYDLSEKRFDAAIDDINYMLECLE